MRADRANVVDYIRQALEALCFPHEHEIAHCAYGDLNDVVMDVGRSSSASFDRTWLPVRYYRVNFSLAQELPREADPRCMRLGGHVPDIEEVPKIGGTLRSFVVVMTGGEYDAEDARNLFEARCKGIDVSTYNLKAPIPIP